MAGRMEKLPYEERLKRLVLPSLERRLRLNMIESVKPRRQ